MDLYKLPAHLDSFNCLTLNSKKELLAVWDNLDFESQLILMKYVINNKLSIEEAIGKIAAYIFREKFFKDKLKHCNEYIRYLAAKEILQHESRDRSWYNTLIRIFQNKRKIEMKPRSVNAKSKKENSSHFADFVIEDEEILDILNIVRTDNSAFVRYSLFEGIEVIDFESRMGILEKEFVELYWSLPIEGRLALAKTTNIENCLLKIIKKCVGEKNPNDYYYEIDQVLAEYVSQDDLKYTLDYWHEDEPNSEAIKKRETHFCILEALPRNFFSSYGEIFCREVQIHPDEYNDENEDFCEKFKKLPLFAQAKLLRRKGIKLQQYRKETIFKKYNEDYETEEWVLKYSALFGMNFSPKELGRYLAFLEKWRESLEWDKRYIVTKGEEYIMSLDHYPLWVYAAVSCGNLSYQDKLAEHIQKAKQLNREDRIHQYKWLLCYFFARDISQNEWYANNFLSGSLEWVKEYIVSGDSLETLDNLINPVIHSNDFSTFFSKNFWKYDFDSIFDLSDMDTNELYLEIFKDFKNYDAEEERTYMNEPNSHTWISEKFAKTHYQGIIILLLILLFFK